MRRCFSLFLLIGALFGLIGQEAAFANVMRIEHSTKTVAVAQMSADCAELMGLAKPALPSPPEKPCQGMTPDCVAKMGCAMAVALLPDAPVNLEAGVATGGLVRIPVERLFGRSLTPEPEPPATLG